LADIHTCKHDNCKRSAKPHARIASQRSRSRKRRWQRSHRKHRENWFPTARQIRTLTPLITTAYRQSATSVPGIAARLFRFDRNKIEKKACQNRFHLLCWWRSEEDSSSIREDLIRRHKAAATVEPHIKKAWSFSPWGKWPRFFRVFAGTGWAANWSIRDLLRKLRASHCEPVHRRMSLSAPNLRPGTCVFFCPRVIHDNLEKSIWDFVRWLCLLP